VRCIPSSEDDKCDNSRPDECFVIGHVHRDFSDKVQKVAKKEYSEDRRSQEV
jgi:hypothetical protein